MVRQEINNKKRTNPVDRPSPTANISKIGSLRKFSDLEYASSLLHQVAKLVAPILHMNNFKVGTLCEMYPKNPNLLGLNVNKGQKILIRLRYHSNDKLFYPLCDIIGTMLHELTHNLYGPHDAKFYKFLDGLKKDFESIQYGSLSKTGYVCEEQTLGSKYNPRGGYSSIRDKRIAALSAHKFKAESRRLGTSLAVGSRINKPSLPTNPDTLRRLILEATERRIKDAKWCPTAVGNTKDIEPDNEDLNIVVVEEEDKKIPEALSKVHEKELSNKKESGYKEVIDLTNEEYEGLLMGEDEIIVIEGCERRQAHKHSSVEIPLSTTDSVEQNLDNVLQAKDETGVFLNQSSLNAPRSSLLASFDEENQPLPINIDEKVNEANEAVQYLVSPSPGRTFIFEGNNTKYPRRKVVADLDFDQIIKKGEKIHILHASPLFHKEASLGNPSETPHVALEQHSLHVKDDLSCKKECSANKEPQTSHLKLTESNTSALEYGSTKHISERGEVELKRRKGEPYKETAKNLKKASTSKETANKNEQRDPVKKTVKSIDFNDLFSKQ